MTCENIVGVKNILVTFYDCDTEAKVGPISHELTAEDLPTWKNCAFTNEAMAQGYVKRVASNASVELNIIRDLRVPLSFYQGCAGIDLQVEYTNGLVMTGKGGTSIGDEKSDGHGVAMEVVFRIIDELLPVGQLAA